MHRPSGPNHSGQLLVTKQADSTRDLVSRPRLYRLTRKSLGLGRKYALRALSLQTCSQALSWSSSGPAGGN